MMATLRRWAGQVLHLFVEDGRLAGSAIAWLAVLWMARRLGLGDDAGAVLIFVGLAAILVLSVLRRARQP